MAASIRKLSTGSFLFIFVLFKAINSEQLSSEEFHEELLIKPLPNGHIYAHFQFTTTWNTDIESESCKLFQNLVSLLAARRRIIKALGNIRLTWNRSWFAPIHLSPHSKTDQGRNFSLLHYRM